MSAPIDVLVVAHEERIGGATLSVLRLRELLAERGVRLRFWVPKPGPLADRLLELGVEVDGASRPLAYSRVALAIPPGTARRLLATPGYLLAFRRALVDRPPDLVHANSLYSLAEAAIARTARVPTVLHVHEMLPASAKGRLGARFAFALTGEVVAVSEASAAALSVGGRRAGVVREAAAIPAAAPPLPAGPNLRVGSVGVISRRKGSDLFVAAAAIVREHDPSIRFELIGAATDPLDAGWAEGVLAEARRVGVEHQASGDVDAALARWDIFVLPSRRDPFPLVVLEAMAAGRPIVGARTDGIVEQLADGAGMVVEPDRPRALAAAILELAADPELRARLGSAARAKASAEFTLERQADGLTAIYQRLLSRSRRSDSL